MSPAATTPVGWWSPTARADQDHRAGPPGLAVVIYDHHPGYISWERFLANGARLAANTTNAGARPPREGHALCQGIIACGSCGRAISTRYHRNGHAAYECSASRADQMATPTCRSISAVTVDKAVAERLLEALNPEEVALTLAAADEVTDRRARRSRAAELGVERAPGPSDETMGGMIVNRDGKEVGDSDVFEFSPEQAQRIKAALDRLAAPIRGSIQAAFPKSEPPEVLQASFALTAELDKTLADLHRTPSRDLCREHRGLGEAGRRGASHSSEATGAARSVPRATRSGGAGGICVTAGEDPSRTGLNTVSVLAIANATLFRWGIRLRSRAGRRRHCTGRVT
jgi:hypothetical protein